MEILKHGHHSTIPNFMIISPFQGENARNFLLYIYYTTFLHIFQTKKKNICIINFLQVQNFAKTSIIRKKLKNSSIFFKKRCTNWIFCVIIINAS